MSQKILFALMLFCAVTLTAQQINNPQQTLNKTDKSFFIENKGQWAPEVKYLARIGGMNAWITNSGVVYDYYQIKRNFDKTKTEKMNPREKQEYENKNTSVQGHVVKMQLVNAENDVTSSGNDKREGYYNYFIGNDKSKWANFVHLYDNVELKGVYKNIDVKYYYDSGKLRYDYKAKPGADLAQIKFKFEGQDELSVNTNGELVIKTSIGEVTNGKLYAYQMDDGTKKEVACQFEQRSDGTVGLKAEGYDTQKELIIDPLVYSTFIGGGDYDQGNSIAIDASGKAYITGYTSSADYPTTPGAYQTSFGGPGYNEVVFIAKLNPTGSALVYSTFIGGNGSDNDYGTSIAIDANGNAYITGKTNSSDYPTTPGAFQITFGGYYHADGDAFVTKINSSGSALVYSTFIGGSGGEIGTSIAVDANGSAYITGFTTSLNYPTTTGAYQTTGGGAFITKLNSEGSALVYSTLIKDGCGESIAIDKSGNAYITGVGYSDYPTTPGAFQTVCIDSSRNVKQDAFITKLNPNGSALVYSTFIGGSKLDYGCSIAIDAKGCAYITGWTGSSNYPTTPGAFQTSMHGYEDVFVTKLNPTGSALVYSTFIGGSSSSNEYSYSIAIDTNGNAYITGCTGSGDFPTTPGAYQTNFGFFGYIYAFITKLNSTGSALLYSTSIGKTLENYGSAIAIDGNGNAYIVGRTNSPTFPTTAGAYKTDIGLIENAFVTKLYIQPIALNITSPMGGEVWQANTIHNIRWAENSIPSAIDIEFSSDGGTNWVNLTSLAPNRMYYSFTIPALNSPNCKIRISIPGLSESPVFLSNNFTITTSHVPNVTLTSPNGGQGFRIGSVQNITWTASSDVANLNILFSTNSGVTWNNVAANIPAINGSYKWVVPAIPSNNCYIKIVSSSDSAIFAYSDSSFSIESIQLLFPKGGEFLECTAQKYVKWNSIGVEAVKILYSTDNGSSWNYIEQSYSASRGFCDWIYFPPSQTKCLVRICDCNDSLVVAQTDSAITFWDWIFYAPTPVFGQNAISFTGMNISMDLLITYLNSYDSRLVGRYFEYQAPLAGKTPDSTSVSNYYWSIDAYRITLTNGDIKIPLSAIPGVVNPNSLVWLMRENSGDPWQNIGGKIVDSVLVNTVPFSSLGEFAIGTKSNVTNVGKAKNNIPVNYSLSQNYPNPFNPTTVIRYGLPEMSNVKVRIYNLLGQLVESLVNGTQTAGYHEVTWNASNKASGIYLYTIEAVSQDGKGNYRSAKKLILLK
jgi:hypothetical protein